MESESLPSLRSSQSWEENEILWGDRIAAEKASLAFRGGLTSVKQVGSQDVAGPSLGKSPQHNNTEILYSPDRWRIKSGRQGWTVKQGVCHPDERSSSMAEAWGSWDHHEQALFLLGETLQHSIPKPIVLRGAELEAPKGKGTEREQFWPEHSQMADAEVFPVVWRVEGGGVPKEPQ